jgi:hypothetical protein
MRKLSAAGVWGREGRMRCCAMEVVERVAYRGVNRGAGVHLHQPIHMPGVAGHLEPPVIARVVQRCG